MREQLRYPHFSLGQISGFIGQNLQFHNLNYDQFIAGELATITNCHDIEEKIGRVKLLQRIALWRLRANVTWPQVRNAFAHILRLIENQEITWHAGWDKYERHIYDKIAIVGPKDKIKKTVSNTDFTWFCKAFQCPEGCNKDAPHPAKIVNSFKQVQHICASCWQKDRTRRTHSESSSDCPHKDA